MTSANTAPVAFNHIFEVLYQAYRSEVGTQTSQAPKILLKYPKEYRKDLFDRWVKDTNIIVTNGGTKVGQNKEWRKGYSSANGAHWFALRSFLQNEKGLSVDRLNALDLSSDNVLLSLGDPHFPSDVQTSSRKFSGLVVGYVQSGKTANYTAVAAKAFDAGFKLVIVLSGVHNSLRRQTQMRMNDELGLLPSSVERPTAAATAPQGLTAIQTLTSEDLTNGDFKYSHLSSSILDAGKFLCVTKKNVAVLKRLRQWLGKNVEVPVLIIDDEADQASIDAKAGAPEDFDPDRDPTAINNQIRQLIKDCTRYRAYVGYTATPYANVFINKDAKHRTLKDDLYPNDFIISLPKPPGYMGPEEFFGPNLTGEESTGPSISDRVIEIVSDQDRQKALDLPKDDSGNAVLPDSILRATKDFILGTAARRVKSGKVEASSFLAHTSHKQMEQVALGEALERLVMKLHQDWRYDKARVEPDWRLEWENLQEGMLTEDYKCDFEDLVPELDELLGKFGSISVRILNFKSPDELDYEVEPNLCAIIVGGNKLSRGLTLEGLIVSYFLRQSSQPKADTLTQMGRFFGYRSHLVDITKVYTTDQLRSEFREISHMESALRRDIEMYARSGKTPADFAPRVMKRAGLLPTGNMGAAKEFGVTYSGDLIQTTSFMPSSKASDVNSLNLKLATKFLKRIDGELGASREVIEGNPANPSKLLWRGISSEEVVKFVRHFQTVPDAKRFNPNNIASYIDDQRNPLEGDPELLSWNVAVVGRTTDATLGEEHFGLDVPIGRIMRSMEKDSPRSIGTLISPLSPAFDKGDELIDFSDEMIAEAKKLKEHESLKAGDAARMVRSPKEGLLLIYPVSPNVTVSLGAPPTRSLGESLGYKDTFVGLALVFPHSDHDQSSRMFWRQ